MKRFTGVLVIMMLLVTSNLQVMALKAIGASTMTVGAQKVPVKTEAVYNFNNMQNFVSKNIYREGTTFTDTANLQQWAKDGIKKAFELGLINGKLDVNGAPIFDPNGNLTVAEAITLLSRLHSTYAYGNTTEIDKYDVANASHWSIKNVSYAKSLGLIDNTWDGVLNKPVTRAEMVKILYNSLFRHSEQAPTPGYSDDRYMDMRMTSKGYPNFTLSKKGTVQTTHGTRNKVNSLPDVNKSTKYFEEIIGFFEVGIVGGNDEAGTFYPNKEISRQEVAVIILRIADKSSRLVGKTFSNKQDYKIGDVTFNDEKGYEYDSGERFITPQYHANFIESMVTKSEGVKVSGKTITASFDLDVPLPYGYSWVVGVETGVEGAIADAYRAVSHSNSLGAPAKSSGIYTVNHTSKNDIKDVVVSINAVKSGTADSVGSLAAIEALYDLTTGKVTVIYRSTGFTDIAAQTPNAQNIGNQIFNK